MGWILNSIHSEVRRISNDVLLGLTMSKPLDESLSSTDNLKFRAPAPRLDVEADLRIANSLTLVSSLLKARARQVGDKEILSGAEARAVLDEFAARIDAIANLHRLLTGPITGSGTDVAAYLTEIAESSRSFGTDAEHIRIFYDFGPVPSLDSTRLCALGLFVGEAIINSFKHAHPANAPGEIRISCRHIDALVVLVIEDDGVGFREGFRPEVHGATGFKVMAALADQLNAKVTRKSTPLGLWTEILFPL